MMKATFIGLRRQTAIEPTTRMIHTTNLRPSSLPGDRIENPRQQQPDAEKRAEHFQPVTNALLVRFGVRVYCGQHRRGNGGIEGHHQNVHQCFLPAPMSKASWTTR